VLINGLDILLAALVFMPLERLLAIHRGRKLLRSLWRLDVTHLLATGLIIQLGMTGVVILGLQASDALAPSAWRAAVAAQPVWLQFIEVLVLADLGFYLAHRTFHAVPMLWRIHSVHHSIEEMDWLAGHRVHPIDQILTKTASLLPIFALGFHPAAVAMYGLLYHWQSLLIHSNVRIDFGPLRWVLASPHFHHWHHANEEEAWDKNFSGQLPLWDMVFGTLHLPKGRMPTRYGIDAPVPDTYVGQLAYPFAAPAAEKTAA
jgi:sterol desaturase/sphingolipid hydroxylase (fatty acid hydroxylase superfamily)